MSRKQKRVYVDEDEWTAIKAENGLSSDSDVMDYVMSICRMAGRLTQIDTDLQTAIGMALAHNKLLANTSISAQVKVVIDGSSVVAETDDTETLETTPASSPPAIQTTDDLSADNSDDY